MRDYAMFYKRDVAEKNKTLLEGLGFRVEILEKPYEGKLGYFVYTEEREPGAEKRFKKTTRT